MVVTVIFLQLISSVSQTLYSLSYPCLVFIIQPMHVHSSHDSTTRKINICIYYIDANVGASFGFPKPWRYLVATILSLVCSYALLVISLFSVWNIEAGTINPTAIFQDNLSGKVEMQRAKSKKRTSVINRTRCDSEGDKKDLLSYIASKEENYDKFTAFLV